MAVVPAMIILLTVILAGDLRVAAAPPSFPPGWAVLIEHNSFFGRAHDLPVAYINSTRMLTLLMRRGWAPDHILLIRDDLDSALLRYAAEWLAARVRPGDTALLYMASEYQWLDRGLHSHEALPGLWAQIPTTRRVLIVETCFAERVTDAVRGIPGLGLPAVGRDEWDWWGLRATNRLIRGGAFTYFLTRALADQPRDVPLDFAAAFPAAVASTQEYFRTVIAATPGALDAFHALGSYPEHLARFPNPHLAGGSTVAAPSAAQTSP